MYCLVFWRKFHLLFGIENFWRGQLNPFALFPLSPTHNFLRGWDPVDLDQISLRGGIKGSLIRFLFGMGSIDHSAPFYIKKIHLRGLTPFLSHPFLISCRRRSLNKVCSCLKEDLALRPAENLAAQVCRGHYGIPFL